MQIQQQLLNQSHWGLQSC